MPHETDLVPGPHLKVRFTDPVSFSGPGQAELILSNQGLCFCARLAETRPKEPDIEAATVCFAVAQDLSPLSGSVAFKAARAANGEFSIDLRGRGVFPAE